MTEEKSDKKKSDKHNHNKLMIDNNSSIFFIIMLVIIIVIIVISASLDLFFKVPESGPESFNLTYHQELEFEDSYRGTNPGADIVFALFIDFSCNLCAAQHEDIKRLVEKHDDVNFLIKHLINPNKDKDVLAAKAFECARVRGKGIEMADYLYDSEINAPNLEAIAFEIGIDKAIFRDCISDERLDEVISSDLYHASDLGVRGTPTAFVNGIKIEGVHSFEVYDNLLRHEKEVFLSTRNLSSNING